MLNALKSSLTSKKFLATIIGALTVALGQAFGLSEDQSLKISGMIGAYVLGQGLADQGKEKEKAIAEIEKELEGNGAAEKAAKLQAKV